MTLPADTEPSAEALIASLRSAIMGVATWEARSDRTNVEAATDIARAVVPILDRFRAAGVREERKRATLISKNHRSGETGHSITRRIREGASP